MNEKRRLTTAEKALVEKIALELPRAAFRGACPRVVVGDEVDEHGRVAWTTTAEFDEVLPPA